MSLGGFLLLLLGVLLIFFGLLGGRGKGRKK